MRRPVPWYVWVALVLAFFGGLWTVAIVAVLWLISIFVRSAVWWGGGPRT